MWYVLLPPAFAEDTPAPGADSSSQAPTSTPPASEAPPAPAASGTPPAAPSGGATPPATTPPASDAAAPSDAPTPALDASGAEDLGLITKKDLRYLRPSPFHLPPNPRGQVDFTAYTLEWGEVKLGLANITIGLLPHVQVGTSVPLDALGIANVTGKVHATEGGPFDIAAYANYYVMPREDFAASFLSTGAITSLTFNKYWSLHLGGGYADLEIDGQVDFSSLGTLFAFANAVPVIPFQFSSQMVTASLATDVRFNRRDSIVLRGETVLWAKTDTSVHPTLLSLTGLDQAVEEDGWMTPDKAYTATLAWQFAWEHIELRVGGGVSSAGTLAWLLQSAELSYRFGGKTRIKERKLRQEYGENVDSVERARTEAKRQEREKKKAERAAKKKG